MASRLLSAYGIIGARILPVCVPSKYHFIEGLTARDKPLIEINNTRFINNYNGNLIVPAVSERAHRASIIIVY